MRKSLEKLYHKKNHRLYLTVNSLTLNVSPAQPPLTTYFLSLDESETEIARPHTTSAACVCRPNGHEEPRAWHEGVVSGEGLLSWTWVPQHLSECSGARPRARERQRENWERKNKRGQWHWAMLDFAKFSSVAPFSRFFLRRQTYILRRWFLWEEPGFQS